MLKESPKASFESNSSLSEHLVLGINGEDSACAILKKRGYAILARNWRKRHYELDIVCEYDNQIVFVEVKTRSSRKRGGPTAAITHAKKFRLSMAAQLWLQENNSWEKQCRFDIICLVKSGNCYHMEHYINAFEAVDTLDSCNSSW